MALVPGVAGDGTGVPVSVRYAVDALARLAEGLENAFGVVRCAKGAEIGEAGGGDGAGQDGVCYCRAGREIGYVPV